MQKKEISECLERKGYSNKKGFTALNTFDIVSIEQFTKTGIVNRNSTGWVKCEIIVIDDNITTENEEDIFNNWLKLTKADPIQPCVQKLLVKYNDTEFALYDNRGKESEKIGRIEDLFKNNLNSESSKKYEKYISAIRTKPFLLLAGISGTGKSRLVRQLARASSDRLKKEGTPQNFAMVPVKPNWHDSSELFGYVSRITGKPKFVMTDFIQFLFKAILNPDIPFFLCLDEMNLAPVEQYFAEYLSVIETRVKDANGKISSEDVLIPWNRELFENSVKGKLRIAFDNYKEACHLDDEQFESACNKIIADGGLKIPGNFIVIGTVNMDETTFSFSRKVLDRAMSFELNEVDMFEGIAEENGELSELPPELFFGTCLNGHDVNKANSAVAQAVLKRLKSINDKLDGTPFKIAYRSRNEIMIYVLERMRKHLEQVAIDESNILQDCYFHQAMDEAISLKILSRIEGDEQKISRNFLEELEKVIFGDVNTVIPANSEVEETTTVPEVYPVCKAKLRQMKEQLSRGYVSFWS